MARFGHEMPEEDARGNRPGTEGDPLDSAISYTSGDARTTGEESLPKRRAAAIAQRRALVRWASARGLILDPRIWEGRAVIGGSEHDIWEEPGEYWKATRDDHFGWTVLPGKNGKPVCTHATPLEYLERWKNANRFLGDHVRLRGVVESEFGVRVVISQPFIKGTHPRKATIARDLRRRGFFPVPGFVVGAEVDSSFYHPEERIGIFDAATDNFILSQGIPVPVDVVILRAGAKLHHQLQRMVSA